MPTPFYIIGHNPNFVKDAIACLRDGANAIEPDVQHDFDVDGHFYISEWAEHDDTAKSRKPTLKKYLLDLKAELQKPGGPAPPALIAFDVKQHDYNIMELYSVIRKNFSNDYPQIAIL